MTHGLDLPPQAWIALALGAALVGFAKTAVGGVGALAIVGFAAVLPAKESTGALLPLLCVGDLIAVKVYHRHADWRVLTRLLPGVVPGMALGAWFLNVADDALVRRAIAATLVTMVVLQVWMRRRRIRPTDSARSQADPATTTSTTLPTIWATGGAAPAAIETYDGADETQTTRAGRARPASTTIVGITAGFATMTANAAGPVTTLYMVLAGLPMRTFLGTAAWFYLIVNAAKAPVSAGLGLISAETLILNAVLVPVLLVGAAGGVWLINRIDQSRFEQVVLASTAVAAIALLA